MSERDIYQEEINKLLQSKSFFEKGDYSLEEIAKEYPMLLEYYEDVLDQLKIITKISDRQQRKINKANELLKDKNEELAKLNKDLDAEKTKSENLLLNIIPIKVVNELKNTGKTQPESFDNVTVYFSDLIGFTNISTQLEPKFLIDELNDLFTAFDDIMTGNHCERIKTIGDAYLAVCGMPTEDENHARNILNSAIEILRYLDKRNATAEIKWKLRIGVHSGRVVGGVVGVRKYIYDVFGDTINTASRMESNSESMRINISETTYNLINNTPSSDKYPFSFSERDVLEVKGKGKMKMYFVDT